MTAKIEPPKCDLKPADSYPPDRLEKEKNCFKKAEVDVRTRYTSLSTLVIVRDAATAEFVKKHAR